MKKTSIIVFLLTISFSLLAQQIDRRLKLCVKEMNLNFSMPKNYLELDSGFNYECWDGKMNNGILYTIMRADSNIRIGIGVNRPITPIQIARIRQAGASYSDDNQQYLITAKLLADTVNHKLIFYQNKYLKESFNADHGGELTRNCVVPFQNKYLYNRIVFLAKDDRGYIQLTYLYTEKAKPFIDEEIKRTVSMVRFND